MNCSFCNQANAADAVFCTSCGCRLRPGPSAPEPVSAPDWETRGHLFNPVSYLITLREILFAPADTFRRLKPEASLFNALLFGLIGGIVGGLAGTTWQYATGLMFPGLSDGPLAAFFSFPDRSRYLATLFFVPLATAAALFAASAVFHFCLTVLHGANRGFAATFKVYAYAQGATALFGIVPVFGGVVAAVWSFIIVVVGLRETHRLSLGKSVAVVLLPVLVCTALAVLLVVLLIMLGVAALIPWLHN